jgi:hypothetical protein
MIFTTNKKTLTRFPLFPVEGQVQVVSASSGQNFYVLTSFGEFLLEFYDK